MESPLRAAQPDLRDLRPLLEDLSRLHGWIALSDEHGTVLWASDDSLANAVLTELDPHPKLVDVLAETQNFPLPEPLRAALAKIQSEMKRRAECGEVRWRFAANPHLTENDWELFAFGSQLPSGQRVLISVMDRVPHGSPEQVARQRILERQNEELESNVGRICHDLRSPLVTLLGFIGLLRDDYGDVVGQEGRHFIERVEQAGVELNSRVDALRTLSRVSTEKDQRTLVNTQDVLTQLQTDLKRSLETNQASLTIRPDLPWVLCDRDHLQQIFQSLVSQAIQHTGESNDRRIEILILDDGAKHRIHVRNHGPGIPDSDLNSLFEEGHAAEGAENRGSSGGVGLPMVRRIAEAYGGEAWAESEAQGTHFYVTLPTG